MSRPERHSGSPAFPANACSRSRSTRTEEKCLFGTCAKYGSRNTISRFRDSCFPFSGWAVTPGSQGTCLKRLLVGKVLHVVYGEPDVDLLYDQGPSLYFAGRSEEVGVRDTNSCTDTPNVQTLSMCRLNFFLSLPPEFATLFLLVLFAISFASTSFRLFCLCRTTSCGPIFTEPGKRPVTAFELALFSIVNHCGALRDTRTEHRTRVAP